MNHMFIILEVFNAMAVKTCSVSVDTVAELIAM